MPPKLLIWPLVVSLWPWTMTFCLKNLIGVPIVPKNVNIVKFPRVICKTLCSQTFSTWSHIHGQTARKQNACGTILTVVKANKATMTDRVNCLLSSWTSISVLLNSFSSLRIIAWNTTWLLHEQRWKQCDLLYSHSINAAHITVSPYSYPTTCRHIVELKPSKNCYCCHLSQSSKNT